MEVIVSIKPWFGIVQKHVFEGAAEAVENGMPEDVALDIVKDALCTALRSGALEIKNQKGE